MNTQITAICEVDCGCPLHENQKLNAKQIDRIIVTKLCILSSHTTTILQYNPDSHTGPSSYVHMGSAMCDQKREEEKSERGKAAPRRLLANCCPRYYCYWQESAEANAYRPEHLLFPCLVDDNFKHAIASTQI